MVYLLFLALPKMSLADAILFLTLLAIIWYSWETYCLRIITAESTRLSNQPILLVSQEGPDKSLYLSNIGKGHAVDISFQVVSEDPRDNWNNSPKHLNMIKVDEKKKLTDLFLGDFPKLLDASLDPKFEGKVCVFISFSDILGNRYKTHQSKPKSAHLKFVSLKRL